MKEISEITNWLKENLSEKRFLHTVKVAETAVSLAQRWGLDKEKAFCAGLLHDSAKEIPKEEAIRLLEDYGYIPDEVEKSSWALLHAPLSEAFARDIFKVCDEEILNAIRYHTTGRANMSLLEKVIYLADIIEPNRSYDKVSEIRELSYKDLDKAVLKAADLSIEYTLKQGNLLHKDTILARDYILNLTKEGKLDES